MEFIKRMKKREFIEMGLKTLAAILAAFLAIILMEGMIYGIELNSLSKRKSETFTSSSIAYCIEKKEDQYFVICYDKTSDSWYLRSRDLLTKEQCENLTKYTEENNNTPVKEVKFKAPNAFDFTITPVHYVVMAIFVSAVAGFFVYKFIALAKQYKKIEEDYEKTGTIEISNV